MLTIVKCPKDNQRLFDVTISGRENFDIEPAFRLLKEIEIKCPKCGGVVAVEIGCQGLNITMKSLGNTGRHRRKN